MLGHDSPGRADAVKCLDVNVDPGGCSWLHAIVQIDKQAEDDGRKAIEAAFAGHSSCKHVFVVDRDIDIYDPQAVEWALATRFQGLGLVSARERSTSTPAGRVARDQIGFDLTRFGTGKTSRKRVS
jgi:3-polyprenyl-4-hydroxybenzoate decarboxylase